MNSLILQLQKIIPLCFIVFALGCFGLLPKTQAVVPPPDGGYPGGNTAEGHDALLNLTTGTYNTALGLFSLRSITTASFNTATGAGALFNNNGDGNTATGAVALNSNTTGDSNTATGQSALFFNTTGAFNTATGASALQRNTAGSSNTATGESALLSNTDGSRNTAIGVSALQSNTTGINNAAVGLNALVSNTTGSKNVALGRNAGRRQTTGSNNIYIGDLINGVAGEEDSCYIGSIFGQTSSEGIAVFINANGKLGTVTSSRWFKNDIKPMEQASEILFALKPVTFRYKKEIDLTGTSQFGLVAEDVERVDPDLVVRDQEGKPYSVRYDQVNAMLLNEFLKEHKAFAEQQRKVRAQGAIIAHLQQQIEALTAGLQKVSAQLELSKPAAQTVLNSQ
jgi:hypothetical protein